MRSIPQMLCKCLGAGEDPNRNTFCKVVLGIVKYNRATLPELATDPRRSAQSLPAIAQPRNRERKNILHGTACNQGRRHGPSQIPPQPRGSIEHRGGCIHNRGSIIIKLIVTSRWVHPQPRKQHPRGASYVSVGHRNHIRVGIVLVLLGGVTATMGSHSSPLSVLGSAATADKDVQ